MANDTGRTGVVEDAGQAGVDKAGRIGVELPSAEQGAATDADERRESSGAIQRTEQFVRAFLEANARL